MEYVELLLNSVNRSIAIRPCSKDNPNAIRWGRLKAGRWCATSVGCKGLARTLFDIMDWEREIRYRFRGEFIENDGDKLMLFELDEPEMIKVENIKGKLVLIGAEDDTLWDTAKYIRRMDERLKAKPHECSYEVYIYKYGTHYVFPESLYKKLLSFAAEPLLKMLFKSAKEHPDECRQTRIDIEKNISRVINEWK